MFTQKQVKDAVKQSAPLKVRSTVDGDTGYALKISTDKDWSRGYILVDFSGQRVWVNPRHLVIAE